MDYGDYKFIKVDKVDKVAIFTLNRPEVLNAINNLLSTEIEKIFADVALDSSVNAIVLTVAGKAFCTGGDIKFLDSNKETIKTRLLPGNNQQVRILNNILSVEQPIISAINGHAIGLGATLALFCDITIAAENAKIGDTHVKVGLVAGDGGSIIWPILCGISRAKEYLLTGDLISAAEAERIGLINHVVPLDQLMPKAMELAHRLANGPAKAIRWTKLALNKRLREDMNLVLDASMALQGLSNATEDHKEAMRAFIEKRPPQFKGY